MSGKFDGDIRGDIRGEFDGGVVRASWRMSGGGECDAISEPAAVRTSGGAPQGRADQCFLSDLPGSLVDSLDVTVCTNGGVVEGAEL